MTAAAADPDLLDVIEVLAAASNRGAAAVSIDWPNWHSHAQRAVGGGVWRTVDSAAAELDVRSYQFDYCAVLVICTAAVVAGCGSGGIERGCYLVALQWL